MNHACLTRCIVTIFLWLSILSHSAFPQFRNRDAASGSPSAQSGNRAGPRIPSTREASVSSRASNSLYDRLARERSWKPAIPQIFAPSPSAPLTVVVFDGLVATTDLPIAGGARRMRVEANNRASPQDRLIFDYERYDDALTADASRFRVGPAIRTTDLHQYTIGFEKTFADQSASIDVRMPFTNQFALSTPNFGVEGGQIGNLNAKLKVVLLSEQDYCLSAGTGFDVPTGRSIDFQGNRVPYRVENDAFFLQPFLAYEESLDAWYLHAFTSIDVGLNGNRFRRGVIGAPDIGRINDQTLGNLSLGGGRWLWLDPAREIVTGFALASELHYTTTFQDSDSVQDFSFMFQSVTVQNISNRSDHLNLTLGCHFLLGSTTLRFGFVQPLRGGDDRLFDQEFKVQLNRLY